jgi:hypothetical protein
MSRHKKEPKRACNKCGAPNEGKYLVVDGTGRKRRMCHNCYGEFWGIHRKTGL